MSVVRRTQVLKAVAGSLSQTIARRQIQALPARFAASARSFSSTTNAYNAAAADAPLKSNISTTSSALVSSTKDMIVNGHRVVAGAVVSRQPLILRDLTPFEQEYFNYQRNLERKNASPFASEFYFKKGSIAEKQWRQVDAERESAGLYGTLSPASAESSLGQDQDSDMTEEDRIAALEAKVVFNDRITEADRKKDMRSLERALARTLYLIVKKPRDQHAWQFPQGGVHVVENLQEAAGRELNEECGSNMDLWFVGRVPIGHYAYSHPKGTMTKSENPTPLKGSKVFFMKAHIFAGNVQIDNKEVVDYAWVTKDEMKSYVTPEYYEAVKDMLSDQ
ncbi:54S ribosomal protein L17 mitochondrial [Lunasporangiospora selenospora]|uniref:Large ribosomal subunit protein mL46 n=1 Tax=Lunasporangiospora selenospora TaxID=979761 RepID=A0A9P6FSJ2_9FUNG|nr:54S ribosomal protein L17 mitochondrial [Lunasporangiospora selenospora]